MNDLETAGYLRAAATYLRTYGWRKGNPGMDGAPRCLGGALVSVTGEEKLIPEGCLLPLTRSLGTAMGFDWMGEWLAVWNDQPERTLDEVLDRLESTALALEVRALAANSAVTSSRIAEPELVEV